MEHLMSEKCIIVIYGIDFAIYCENIVEPSGEISNVWCFFAVLGRWGSSLRYAQKS
jgi:hypothetical protein